MTDKIKVWKCDACRTGKPCIFSGTNPENLVNCKQDWETTDKYEIMKKEQPVPDMPNIPPAPEKPDVYKIDDPDKEMPWETSEKLAAFDFDTSGPTYEMSPSDMEKCLKILEELGIHPSKQTTFKASDIEPPGVQGRKAGEKLREELFKILKTPNCAICRWKVYEKPELISDDPITYHSKGICSAQGYIECRNCYGLDECKALFQTDEPKNDSPDDPKGSYFEEAEFIIQSCVLHGVGLDARFTNEKNLSLNECNKLSQQSTFGIDAIKQVFWNGES